MKTIKQASEGEASVRATSKKEMTICWQKLDRKSKKVNFLISQANQHLEDKATAETMEDVGE